MTSYEPSGHEFSLVLGGGHLRGRLIAADLRAEGVCFAASTDRHLLRARAAPAGDLDSDGFGDFFICAESTEWPGVDGSGRIYLIFGQREFAGRYLLDEDVGGPSLPGVVFSWSSDLKAQGAVRVSRFGKDLPGFIVLVAEGAAPDKVLGDEAGWAVAGPGDVNGDGFADLLVGAPHTDPPRPIEGGHVYLILGSPSPPAEIDLKELCPRCIRMHGAPDGPNGPNGFGKAIAGIGDVNGDSLADFIIGACGDCCLIFRATTHGRVYLVLGRREFPQELDLEAEVGRGVIVFDETPGERAGFAVSPAGDMDLDGVPDIIATSCHDFTQLEVGRAWLIYGSNVLEGVEAVEELLAEGRAVEILIEEGFRNFKESRVAGGIDLDGDGFADVAIGVQGIDAAEGAVFVLHGGRELEGTVALPTAPGGQGVTVLRGEAASAQTMPVASAGDFDGDGLTDLVVGAPGSRTVQGTPGKAYLVLGAKGEPAELSLSRLGSRGFGVAGVNAFGGAGYALAGGGDFDGNGRPDVAIAEHEGVNAAGNVYILLSPFGGTRFRRGDATGDGRVDIADAIRILGYLFLGEPPLECLDAGDINDSGSLDISDPIALLGYFFLGFSSPPAPGPRDCGVDLSADALPCERSPCIAP